MEIYDLIKTAAATFQNKVASLKPTLKIKRPRSALDRLKARMRYRRNRVKIKLWRRRYEEKRKLMMHARKLLKREKPNWFGRTKPSTSKPKSFGHFLKNLTKEQAPHVFHSGRPVSSPMKFHIFNPKFRHANPTPVTPK